jgi:hypothetical protein
MSGGESAFGSMRCWLMPARLWVAALVALWGWAGVSVANAEPGQTVGVSGETAASTGMAGDVSPCPGNTVPIQIMTPGYGSEIERSATDISESLPHFRPFVTAVTERVSARLAKDKLCINGAESVESMRSAESKQRSLLQFVRWRYSMLIEFIVPVLPPETGGRPFPNCEISSPWIDLVVHRKPVPQIRGIVRWNERQFLADQAVLAGAQNVQPGVAMPLMSREYGYFFREYVKTERCCRRSSSRPAAKPIEERILPELLWLFRRSGGVGEFFHAEVREAMGKATEKGAEGYTKLVIALIDRCFDPDGANPYPRYNSILDAADLIPLEQYKIDSLD